MDNIFKKTRDKMRGGFLPVIAKAFIVLILLCLGVLMFLRPTTAENSKANKSKITPAQTSAPQASPQPAQLSVPAVNPITQAAVKAGVLFCVSRINQVATYLTGNSQSGAFLFFPQRAPDQSIFSTSIEVQGPNAAPIYASASFAPLTSGQAGAVYDAVEYVAQSCDFAGKSIFKNLKRIGVIKKDIVILDGGAVRVFLMPAGSGCIVIKKEVVQ